MVESYPGRSLIIGDEYILADSIAAKQYDYLVRTGNTVSGRTEVTVAKAGSIPKDFVGICVSEIAAATNFRLISTLIRGPAKGKVSVDVTEGASLMLKAPVALTQDFTEDGLAPQELRVDQTPINTITSVTQDFGGVGLALTESTTYPPAAGKYYADKERGIIVIGTSVDTKTCRIVYAVEKAALALFDALIEDEVMVVTTHVGPIVETPKIVHSVISTAGTLTGDLSVKYSGTPTTGEVTIDVAAKTATFAAADVVTAAEITYTSADKIINATALKPKTAGNLAPILVERA